MSAGDRREPAAGRRLSEVACWYLAPALVYLVGFAALTWPLVLRFSTHFYCDDIEQTVAELASRGVEFTAPTEDHGYGLVTFFKVPGGFEVQLYQPRYSKRAARSAGARSVSCPAPPSTAAHNSPLEPPGAETRMPVTPFPAMECPLGRALRLAPRSADVQ